MSRYFPKRRVYEGAEATKAEAAVQGSQVDILHFATHAEFRPNAPAQSRLFLTPDAGDNGNVKGTGDFTVADMFATPIKADMVTLSACDTGLGKLSSGEEIIGWTELFSTPAPARWCRVCGGSTMSQAASP